MVNKKEIELSREEYDLIIKEFSNRIRDMAYGENFEERLKKQHPKYEFEKYLNENDTKTDFDYRFVICAGDLIQILNRIRRNKSA